MNKLHTHTGNKTFIRTQEKREIEKTISYVYEILNTAVFNVSLLGLNNEDRYKRKKTHLLEENRKSQVEEKDEDELH